MMKVYLLSWSPLACPSIQCRSLNRWDGPAPEEQKLGGYARIETGPAFSERKLSVIYPTIATASAIPHPPVNDVGYD